MRALRILVAAALLIAPLPARAQGTEELRIVVLTNERAPDGWYQYGLALYEAENYRDAIGAFQRALQLGARNVEVPRHIARAYAELGDDRQAQRWTELAEGQFPLANRRSSAVPVRFARRGYGGLREPARNAIRVR